MPTHLQLEVAVAQEHLGQSRGKLVDGTQELPGGERWWVLSEGSISEPTAQPGVSIIHMPTIVPQKGRRWEVLCAHLSAAKHCPAHQSCTSRAVLQCPPALRHPRCSHPPQHPPVGPSPGPHRFCTMFITTQSPGYTVFPIRSLKRIKVSMRKSCKGGRDVRSCAGLQCPLGGSCEGGAGARGPGVAVGQHSPSAQVGRGTPGCRCCSGPCPSGSGWRPCRPRSGSGGEELVRPCWVLQPAPWNRTLSLFLQSVHTLEPQLPWGLLAPCPPWSLLPQLPRPPGPFMSSSQTVYPIPGMRWLLHPP